MAASSIGGRSTTFIRTIFKKNPLSISTSPRFSFSPPSSSPPIFLRRTPISPSPTSSFRVRRELCSLLPAYSAIASACLVSRLPDGLDSSAESSSDFYVFANSDVKFNGLNYDDWSEQIWFTPGIMSLDLAIQMDEQPATPTITNSSSDAEKSLYDAWERSNRLCLNLMRMTMAKSIKPSMPKTESAKEFLHVIKECSQFDLADKSMLGSLMSELTTKKFDWSQPIHGHVTHMSNLAAKLRSMGMDVSESFLVQFIINSLPPDQFGQFQVNYNTIKDKWNFQELKAMLVQEEGRLKKMKDQAIHLMGQNGASSNKGKPGKKGKNKDKTFVKGPQSLTRKDKKCFFCKKSGHFKKKCPKRKVWFEKKGLQLDPVHKGSS